MSVKLLTEHHLKFLSLKRGCTGLSESTLVKVSKVAKIRNRYNQVPHLTQDTNGKVTNSQKTPQTRAKRSALLLEITCCSPNSSVLCLGQDFWGTQVSFYLNFRGTFTNSGGHTKSFKFLPIKLNTYQEISVHFLFKFKVLA